MVEQEFTHGAATTPAYFLDGFLMAGNRVEPLHQTAKSLDCYTQSWFLSLCVKMPFLERRRANWINATLLNGLDFM